VPHVVVKLFPGRSEAQKARLAEAITRAVMVEATCDEDAVSVGIEDVAPEDWDATVFEPEIRGKADTLFKKPGYGLD
jgi:4-oxalocrotonate tautomerase